MVQPHRTRDWCRVLSTADRYTARLEIRSIKTHGTGLEYGYGYGSTYSSGGGVACPILEKVFKQLSTIETQVDEVDQQVQKFKIWKTEPIYKSRRDLLSQIPKFWYVVLAEHEDFQEYIRTEDMKYLEFIKEIYVSRVTKVNADEGEGEGKVTEAKSEDEVDPGQFSITFKFEAPSTQDSPHKNHNHTHNHNNETIETQTVTKHFTTIKNPETGETSLRSKPAPIAWPTEFNKINPRKLKTKAKSEHRKLTTQEKKNYRVGMKSFFAFFDWTGEKPGKEFRNGEELASLIADEIFPAAVDYYTVAAANGGVEEDEGDDEAGTSSEELDLSDDEEEEGEEDEGEERSKKRQKTA
ncbi:unnamed protein product [Ambrosiozyma monospora]|uniref:Unnamed protein product n=1 Tax=Ambrosiozyma monospora TaxID=43982 RepID=A0ACB5T0J1_AMBMO|nr:unnamed protein product [Ambrosiozyma monospora]